MTVLLGIVVCLAMPGFPFAQATEGESDSLEQPATLPLLSPEFPFPAATASEDGDNPYVPFAALEAYSRAMFHDHYAEAETCFRSGPEEPRELTIRNIANTCWPFLIGTVYHLTRYTDIGDTSAIREPIVIEYRNEVNVAEVDSPAAIHLWDTWRFEDYQALRETTGQLFSAIEELAEKQQDQRLEAACLFAQASLYGLDAIREEAEGHTFSAFGPSMKSAKLYRKAYELDSTLVDAQVGFAVYDYWVSKTLGWTPFVRDSRDESLQRLREVMVSGSYMRFAAAGYLSWLLIEEKEYVEAARVADSMLTVFPDCRAFLEPAGKAYFLAAQWDEARDRYTRFVRSLQEAPTLNVVRVIGGLHRLGQIAKEQRDWETVINVSRQAHELTLNPNQLRRKQEDLNRLADYAAKARRLLSNTD